MKQDITLPPILVGQGPDKKGTKTSEFGAMIAFIAKNIVVLLVLVGYVSVSDKADVTSSLTAFLTALVMAGTEGFALWKYITSRTQLKSEALQLRTQMLTDDPVQKLYSLVVAKEEGKPSSVTVQKVDLDAKATE